MRSDLDQPIATPNGVVPEHGDAREHPIPLTDLRLAGAQALEVPLLGGQKVEERRCDGAVGAGGRHLQLLVSEVFAHVEQVQVRPFVVAKRLDEQRFHGHDSITCRL